MDTNFNFTLEGLGANQILEQAKELQLQQSDAAVLVSSWIFQNFGRTRRTFNYVQEFLGVDPDCVPDHTSTFAHDEWIDGESVVQAGKTAGEKGFNARFKEIEDDLGNLTLDVAKAFACVAETRLALRALLDEIRAEINRLNADLFELRKGGDNDGAVSPTTPPFIGLLEQNKFLGTAIVNEKPLGMWQTPQGVMMLPQIITPRIGLIDRRAVDPGRLAAFVEQARVRDAFDGPVTKEAFIEKFGNELTQEGVLIREIVQILPDNAFEYATLNAMVEDLTERSAAVIRSTPGAPELLASTFGLQGTVTGEVDETSVDRFTTVPPNVSVALKRGELGTIGALANADVQTIVSVAEADGVQLTTAEAAVLKTNALTLSRTGLISR